MEPVQGKVASGADASSMQAWNLRFLGSHPFPRLLAPRTVSPSRVRRSKVRRSQAGSGSKGNGTVNRDRGA